MTSGIYEIRNTISGKTYVGQSLDTKARFYNHKWHLNRGSHKNPHLQSAWKKYGATAFVFVVIFECSPENLTAAESLAMEAIPQHLRYNLGECTDSPQRGRKHSAETRALFSKQRRGKPSTPVQRAARRAALSTPEHRAFMSAKYGGRPIEGVNVMTGEAVRFDFVSQAKDAGFSPSEIRACLVRRDCRPSGKRTTHKGYRWRYLNENHV